MRRDLLDQLRKQELVLFHAKQHRSRNPRAPVVLAVTVVASNPPEPLTSRRDAALALRVELQAECDRIDVEILQADTRRSTLHLQASALRGALQELEGPSGHVDERLKKSKVVLHSAMDCCDQLGELENQFKQNECSLSAQAEDYSCASNGMMTRIADDDALLVSLNDAHYTTDLMTMIRQLQGENNDLQSVAAKAAHSADVSRRDLEASVQGLERRLAKLRL